jgi:dTDP-4-dehydrorhamnose 3,5-epimerase
MRFSQTPVAGAFVIEPEPHGDERGFFARLWCQREFAEHGLDVAFVQCNTSYSRDRGTLRGLHYQTAPHGEVKLVRCTAGVVYDVIVDLRPASATFLQWFGVELSAWNHKMMYVPEGCAHGYLTLDDESEVSYPVTQFYCAEAERGVRWNDGRFNIVWPAPGVRIVSSKDQAWPDYRP